MTAIHENKDDILNSLKSNTKNQDHEHQNHSTSFFFLQNNCLNKL